MTKAEENVLAPEAVQELRERWVNDIGGALGCMVLFIATVGQEANSQTGMTRGISAVCLLAVANFVGGAFDKGQLLAAQRELSSGQKGDPYSE